MRRATHLALAAAGAAAAVACLAVPRDGQAAVSLVLGAVAVGALGRRGRGAPAWLLLAAGALALAAGDLVAHLAARDGDAPFPGPADALYLVAYPALAVGLVLLARPRRERGASLDALAVVVGCATPLWFVWAAPALAVEQLGSAAGLVSVAYAAGDLVLVAAAVALALAGGARERTGTAWLVAAVALTFAADVGYSLLLAGEAYDAGSWLDVGWRLALVCWAAAALAPPGRRASAADQDVLRTALLAMAVATGPVVLAGQLIVDAVRAPALTVAAAVAAALLATRGGRRFGRPRDLLVPQTLAFLAAPVVVLVMAGGLAALQHADRARGHDVQAVVTARAAVAEVRAHEREVAAANGLRAGELDELVAELRDARAGVGALRDTGLPADGVEAVTAAFARYRAISESGLSAYLRGEVVDSDWLDDVRLDPAYTAVDRHVEALAREGRAAAARSRRLTDVASIVTLAAGLLAMVLLLLRFARAQRAATTAQTLRASEERLTALVANSSDAIAVVGEDLTVLWQAASLDRILGHPEGTLVGTTIGALVHPDDLGAALRALGEDRAAVALRLRHAGGRWLDVEAVVNDRRDDPHLRGYVVNLRDVSERKALEAKLHHQAFHDHLTGLANRALFEDRLAQAVRRAARDERHVGVVYCDLDDFKDVNDTLGHAVGDELLVSVAERLDGEVRGADTLARVGGDEFLLLLDGLGAPEEAEQVAARILAALREPVRLAGEEHVVRASVGVAVGDGHADAASLLRDADTAMYAAKRQGGSAVQRFAEHMGEEVATRLRLRSELELALERGEFLVHHQPIVALGSGAVVGTEALVRWEHPERGLVPPDAFIPLAEQTGLIVPLGAWVLEQACADVARWRQVPGRQDLYVSVNLAGRQLLRPELPGEVAEALVRHGLPPGALLLEVTESSLIDDVEGSARRLEELSALGVRLAIDDFGTGYSALSYLRRFPMDVLKIDRSFVRGIGDSERDEALVDAIVKMSTSLGLSVVAEGVEDERQRACLDELRCSMGQGYLFSRPVPARQLDALLAGRADLPA